jgi:uncharacterized protein YdiU (UPF0061 family)
MAATAELTLLDQAIDRGTRRLLELQRPDGIWVGELESNVTMTAQHLFWNHYLGLRTPELDRRIANEILARMRAHNPAVIPRNHKVEEALDAAWQRDDYGPFHRLLAVLADPYAPSADDADYRQPAPPGAPAYRTFCGT